MNFALSEEQRWLQKNARDFFAIERPVEWQEMARQGWPGLILPAKYGGLGLGFFELALLMEEMGYALAPGPFFATVIFGGLPILTAGSERQKKLFLPRIARGELQLSLAGLLTNEPGLIMKDEGRGFIVEGQAAAVLEAQGADWFVVSALRAGSDREHGALSLFLVEGCNPNVVISKLNGPDPSRNLYQVKFQGAKVAANMLLGRPGQGRAVLQKILACALAALSAEMAGATQKILDMCVSYARQRTQFGKAIGSFQAVQHGLADMKVTLENSRSLAYHAAWAVECDARNNVVAAMMAKAYAGEVFLKAAMDGVQIHGAVGFASEHGIHRYLRRALGCQGFCADALSLRERLARALLD
ncbi:MAG: hypothetical protein A3J74_06700 [Elusimicrobia bacterium RIFCSPHIGHO2_02_FULL_57_9]|nr:MAG: hypothetical protein A3J74_06700 [Elusimicrobia bacterium RIFCSPHIGHO2_02_FULL_57_9]